MRPLRGRLEGGHSTASGRLPPPGRYRPALLRELLRLELDHRSRHGERPTVEEYRLRLPEYVHFVHETFINHSSVGPEGPVLSTLCGAPSLPAASQMVPALEVPNSHAGRSG